LGGASTLIARKFKHELELYKEALGSSITEKPNFLLELLSKGNGGNLKNYGN